MRQTNQQALSGAFRKLRRAAEADPFPSLEARKASLRQLLALTQEHEAAICAAIDADFGGRSHHETRLAELVVVRAGIRHALSHLSSWMAERRVPTAMPFRPARNRLLPQPLGVVGIVSPWNYPFQLAVAPATAALAAGNRVLVKPSELTPRFSQLLAELAARHFSADQLSVVTGDAELGKAFVALPFDHLLFTGSTAVGRQVALAAAANLTPVTLELGGKSPAILDPSCDLDRAVASVAHAKLLNAGQTCIAPDYLMVPKGSGTAVAGRLAEAIGKLYPTLSGNPDYTAIVSDRHHARLRDRTRALIDAHLRDPALDVGFLAAQLNCSKRLLHAAHAGSAETLAVMIQRSRLEACMRDLRGPALADRTVTEIALSWGFNNASHFSRVFRAHVGMTPGAWRVASLSETAENR